jgi:hypothetical protein
MDLEQQQLTFDTTEDQHVSKRLKLSNPSAYVLDDDEEANNNILEDDAQDEAADAAVDSALQMLARDHRDARGL